MKGELPLAVIALLDRAIHHYLVDVPLVYCRLRLRPINPIPMSAERNKGNAAAILYADVLAAKAKIPGSSNISTLYPPSATRSAQ